LARPETVMSYNATPEGSVILRLEFSIADAVHQRGLLSVIGAAISAWWDRPRLPTDLPPYLREDVGLPPDATASFWPQPSADPQVPPPLWRPGM